MDFLKEILFKDLSEHIPYMMGAVVPGGHKLNYTRLSEVFIPFGFIIYLLFGIMEDQEKIVDRITKIENSQSVSISQIKDLKRDVGGITNTLQKIGFAKLTE